MGLEQWWYHNSEFIRIDQIVRPVAINDWSLKIRIKSHCFNPDYLHSSGDPSNVNTHSFKGDNEFGTLKLPYLAIVHKIANGCWVVNW